MRTLFMLLVVYVASYAYLSKQGSYQVVTSDASKLHLPDGRAWQPKGCEFSMGRSADGDRHTVDANTLGLVFMPAIVVDRAFVHKARPLT